MKDAMDLVQQAALFEKEQQAPALVVYESNAHAIIDGRTIRCSKWFIGKLNEAASTMGPTNAREVELIAYYGMDVVLVDFLPEPVETSRARVMIERSNSSTWNRSRIEPLISGS
jgi:hypothetical protein